MFKPKNALLFGKVVIPEYGVGVLPIAESPLNAKKEAMKNFKVIKHMLRLIYEIFQKISLRVFF